MNTAKLRPVSVEYVSWNDNLSEVKHFCLDRCKITYETCAAGGDYWDLQVYDDFREKWVTVPLGHLVVKFKDTDRLTVVDPIDFREFFEE